MTQKTSPSYKVGDLVEVETGGVISNDLLNEKLLRSRIVFVGESHINPDHHAAQLEIIRSLRAKGAKLAIGMEMFPREKQPVLDQWVKGSLSEDEFLKQVEWDEVWGYPFALYRDILVYARDNKIPVIALNAPRDVVNKTAEQGLDSLEPADRERIASDIRLDNQAHRQVIKERFAEHPPTESDFERFYEAQRVWDETMGETVVNEFREMDSAPDTMVVLAGTGHMLYRLGIPDAVARRADYSFVVIVPAISEDVQLLVEENAADYIRASAPTPRMPHRPMIGVALDPEELKAGRLVIIGVMDDSPAKSMGLAKGDAILKVNGQEVGSAKDIHDALKESADKQTHTMTVRSNGVLKTRSFKLPPD